MNVLYDFDIKLILSESTDSYNDDCVLCMRVISYDGILITKHEKRNYALQKSLDIITKMNGVLSHDSAQ